MNENVKKSYTSSWITMGIFAALGIPSFIIVFANLHFDPVLLAFIFGMGIVLFIMVTGVPPFKKADIRKD